MIKSEGEGRWAGPGYDNHRLFMLIASCDPQCDTVTSLTTGPGSAPGVNKHHPPTLSLSASKPTNIALQGRQTTTLPGTTFCPVWSTLIGRGMSRLVSHWSRASIVMLRQQSYDIKNQLGHPKPPTMDFGTKYPPNTLRWFFMA